MLATRWILGCALVLAGCGSSGSQTAGTSPDPATASTTGPDSPAATAVETEAEPVPPPAPSLEALRAAIDTDARPAEDRARDAGRKPAEVLHFLGIGPGMTVAEMMAGAGYYVEVLARVVGPEGTVYAQNNKFVLERFAEKPLSERLENPDLGHVVRLDRELDDPGLPVGQLDAVLMILFYHDTFWMGADRSKMNRAIFDSLKPGGTYAIIDHHAESGSGDRDVKTIHRIDIELVKKDILAAGFELAAESDLLRNPDDDHTINVFKPEIRGQTDRFVLHFRKPVE